MTAQRPGQGPNPQDMRNVLIFTVIALAFYWAWDAYVLAPRRAVQAPAPTALVAPQPPVAPVSRDEALAAGPRLAFENGEVRGSIALRGAVLDDLSLLNYFQTVERVDPVVLLAPRGTAFDRSVAWGWQAPAGQDAPTPGSETLWTVETAGALTPENPVTLAWDNGQGLTFRRTLALDEDFVFSVTQSVENIGKGAVTLHPFARVSQSGIPADSNARRIQKEGPVGFIGDHLVDKGYKSVRKEGVHALRAQEGWVGLADKYWLTALVPPQGQVSGFGIRYTNGRYQSDTIGAPVTIAHGETETHTSRVFAGAKELRTLERYAADLPAPRLDLAVNFGWFWFLSKPFFRALHWLGKTIGNMGWAIIVLTLVIRGAAFPLTNISYRSFAHMKKISPQILELRKRCGDDKTKLQGEIMKLYEREKVNPLAGCLPILIQIPIFFALYKVLYVTIEMRHAPFFGWLTDLSAPDPTTVFNLFGLIPWDPPGFLQIGVLPLIMLAALLVQKNLNPPPQDALQRDLQTWFPFIMVFMLAHFPAGLVLYWAVSSVFSVAQQIAIMLSMGMDIHLFKKSKAEEALEESLGHVGDAKDAKDKE